MWNLGNRKVMVVTHGSGPNRWSVVRVLWSDKLGLQLRVAAGSLSCEAAQRVAKRIQAAGRINPELWQSHFYPKHFDQGHFD